ncbi:hypothetical protein EMIT0373P_30939 [Pseudomonas chlororaphis]
MIEIKQAGYTALVVFRENYSERFVMFF